MSLFDVQSMEWTPPARLLASIAGTLALSGSMLIFPCLSRYFYKVEPHTQKICKSRTFELGNGAHLLYWSFAMVGGLLSGAQVTCMLLLPSMLAWTCYHYSAGGMSHAVLNFALTISLAYFGFVPLPTVQPMEWTPAAIFLAIHTPLVLMAAVPMLVGGKIMDSQYDQKPWVKDMFCGDFRHAREIALGAQLLGGGCCQVAAILSGGAQDMCLLVALPLAMTGYCHWLLREFEGEQATAIFSWVLVALMVGFGIVR